ncbi:unnamed protein product [Vitrella brassicaformis CCMP3155]|uniref:Staphylococcal nuclease domain-containing protein n=2 Tax=Vitrella brassicaformis TaxID=1169539 RepID=A0A0G4H2P7_VITBC|nr:unnamed protein product [Vitrella brassicaformis CCMP3155]|mmetsp:Transcript_23054/g.56993  ORF Transcript_23054/g.56993 Transcript_23054/m.56993 type:complete len:934 (+) Transcript_23054:176-2977(+)|eukprot:CEM37772.1 unnamed protein product [Vitrella brassicaformis CCMP3155]
MAGGFATVKQVVSGDTFVLVGAPRGGPPPEKQLSLASIIAPRIAMKSLTKETQDEPFGWNAREFIRKKIIGKQVEFKVEYSQNDREYGWIKFEGNSISIDLLKQGLVKLKPNRSPGAHDYDELKAAEEEAQAAKRGLWTDDTAAANATMRQVTFPQNDPDFVKSFAAKHKGERLPAIVEYVRDGGAYRVIFTQDNIYIPLILTGIQADGWKRAAPPLGSDNKPIVENGGGGPPQQMPLEAEPFAAECKYFVEVRVLNRDVDVRVEGADEYGNLYGTIWHPKGGNISLVLLQQGFAKIQDYSARMAESLVHLREAQKEAQTKKMRKWKNYRSATTAGGSEYPAKVIDISSADSVTVIDLTTHQERRLYLASIKAPRPGGRGKEDEPWSLDAKEFARKKLVNKKVKVVVDYAREPIQSASGAAPPPASDAQGRMHYVSLIIEDPKAAGNFSEMLVAAGYARVMSHRADDDRAGNYDILVEKEKEAVEKKLGLHGDEKKAPKHRLNDLLGPQNSARARTFENSLVRLGKFDAVVEHVFNAGRYKLRVPSQNIAISFSLGGIKCPMTARPTVAGGKPKGDNEPFAEESIAFAREHVLQHDVTVCVDACDRGGNFIGSMWRNRSINMAVELLELGYAVTVGFSVQQSPYRDELLAAENKAKQAKLKMWSLPDMASNGIEDEKDREVDDTLTSVAVVHINSITSFYIQETHNPTLEAIIGQLSEMEMKPGDEYSAGGPPRKGEIVLGKFTDDQQWYRARVESRDTLTEEVTVLYIDYGNGEGLPLSRLCRCPPNLTTAAKPPQAKHCTLAGLLEPPDMEMDAAQYLSNSTASKLYHCKVERIDQSGKRHVILTEEEAHNHSGPPAASLNELLVRQGLARLDKKSNTKLFARLQKEEESARKSHVNVWRYGDVGEDEEEDYPSLNPNNPRAANAGGAKRK